MKPLVSVSKTIDSFSPLAQAVLDRLAEGVIVFDSVGEVIFANQSARLAFDDVDLGASSADRLRPRLEAFGARVTPLISGHGAIGEAVYLPSQNGETTLAQRERSAIVETLRANGWKLALAAEQLGISRTTLWRRLKAYGLHRDGRTRPRDIQAALD